MTKPEPQKLGEPEASLRVDPKHRWADIGREIRHALMRTKQPKLFWLHVKVDASGVSLSGQVNSRREYELAVKVAERHACGLPITNQISIWAETTSRVNE
jgi:hypothetical protein